MYFPTITAGSDLHGLCAILSRLILTKECGLMHELGKAPSFRSIKSVFRPSGLSCDPNTGQRTNASLPLTCPHDPGTPRPKSRFLGGTRLYTFRHRLLFITDALASVLNRTLGGHSNMLAGFLRRIPSTYCIPISRAYSDISDIKFSHASLSGPHAPLSQTWALFLMLG